MFMTYEERDKVDEILGSYRAWAYNDCEYNNKEVVRFVVSNELDSEIYELNEEISEIKKRIRILELAKMRVQDEGL